MYLTRESDYAVRIVLLLAQRREKIDAKTISEQTGVTFRFALKILRKLVDSGLIRSYQGAKGGYRFEKAPAEVTLYDILHTIEGDLAVSRCLLGGEHTCTLSADGQPGPCKLQKAFSHITEVLHRELTAVTVDDLI